MARWRRPARAALGVVTGLALVTAGLGLLAVPAAATTYANVTTELGGNGLRTAWTDATATEIDLGANITLGCNGVAGAGVSVRNSATAVVLNGHGFSITQTCATGTANGVLEQDGTGAVTLENVTVTGGRASTGANPSGGGIDLTNAAAALTVSSAAFTNDTVTSTGCSTGCGPSGGGIETPGPLTVTASSFTNDSATVSCTAACGSDGGAIFAGLTTITGSTLSNNTATTTCTVFCGSDGGAIDTTAALTVTGSTLSNNTASTSGCGICGSDGGAIDAGALTVTGSTLSNNTATTTACGACGSDGGAIDASAVTVTNSTIAANTADADGGGIDTVALTLVYATVSGNAAPTGANVDAGTLTSFASVIANPSGGVNCSLAPSATTSHGFNLEDDAAASCEFATATGDLPPGTGANLGALAGNGGPTQTLLPEPGSPLIDGVPIASCQADGAAGVTTDQRGVTRPQGAGCDVGAVEVAVSTALIVAAFTG